MQNEPTQTGNPALPTDAEAAKKTQENVAEGELEKSEAEKEKESKPEDKESFNVDKVDDLNKVKKENKD